MAHFSLENVGESTADSSRERRYLSFYGRPTTTSGILSIRLLVIFLFLLFGQIGKADSQSGGMMRPQNPPPTPQKCDTFQNCKGSGAECNCFSRSIAEYFQEALHESARLFNREPKVMWKMIDRFQCPCYIPLPPFLEIQMRSSSGFADPTFYFDRRRRIRRKRSLDYLMGQSETGTEVGWRWDRPRQRRQITLGYPSEDKFLEVIANVPRSSSHHYASLGTEITLSCLGDEDEDGGELHDSGRRFNWSHVNGRPITAPLVIFNKFNGALTFKSVRLADTGLYNCTATSEDEERKHQSQLDVISSPMVWLKFGIIYRIDRCRRRELSLIQENLLDWVHRYVCHFCPVRNVSATCAGEEVHIQFTLSSLGFEKLLAYDHYSSMCPVECLEKMHTKILIVLAASLKKLFGLPIHVEPVDGKTTVYDPDPNTVTDDIALGCPSGFFENYKLCCNQVFLNSDIIPCAAGKYSPHGQEKCYPCHKNYFQPNPGSSACLPCPKGFSTMEEGSRSQAECMLEAVASSWSFILDNWLYFSIVAVVCLLILGLCLVCCCCPDSGFGRCLRCKCFGKDKGDNGDEETNEKLIQDEYSSTEEGGEEEDEEVRYATVGKRKWLKNKMSRPWKNIPKIPKFPRYKRGGGYRPYDDDDRSIEGETDVNKIETLSTSDGDDLKPLPPDILKLNLPSPASLSRKKNSKTRAFESSENDDDTDLRLLPPDIVNMNLPSPASLSRKGKLKEKIAGPNLGSAKADTEDADSGPDHPTSPFKDKDGRICFKVKKPHVKLGTLLNTSRSLHAKLAEQRKKIGDLSSRSKTSLSNLGGKLKRSKVKGNEKLKEFASRSKSSLSKLGGKLKRSRSNVKIDEHKNTYHSQKREDSRKNGPSPSSPKNIKDIYRSKGGLRKSSKQNMNQ